MPRPQHFYFVIAAFVVMIRPAYAQEERPIPDDKGIFNMVWENDKFAGTDRDYTNGVRFSWLSSEENMPKWSRNVADTHDRTTFYS